MAGKEDQGFSFETMAVVLYCVLESGVTIGNKHYDLMSALDGSRSAAAFQHQFRKVKARAKALKEEADKKGSATDATPVKTKGRGAGSKTATPSSSKKRGRKPKDDDEQDDEEQGEEETPSKKHKVKKEQTADDDDGLI